MLDQRRGFALDTTGRLLRTMDSGHEWRATGAAITPSLAPAVAVLPPDAVIVAGQHGAGEILLMASIADGTVHQLALPAAVHGVSGVSFVDAQRGWALANVAGTMGSEGFDLFRTVDGGTSWTLVASAGPRDTALGQPPFDGDKSGISFRDRPVGWLTGGYNTLGTYFFYQTDDGGRTWHSQSLPVPPGYQRDQSQLWTDPPRWFGAQAGILPVTMLAVHPTLIFYITHDGGASWVPTTPIHGSAANDRFVWSFSDAQHGWTTNGGPLWETSDGGGQWTAIQPQVSLAEARQLQFVDAEHGWAVLSGAGCHEGQILETGDGGHTWTTVAVRIAE